MNTRRISRSILLMLAGAIPLCACEDQEPPRSRETLLHNNEDAACNLIGPEPPARDLSRTPAPNAEPTHRFPAPSGPHSVGSHTLYLTDPSRPEHSTENTQDFRQVVVQLFYPAEPNSAPQALWLEPEVESILYTRGLPPDFTQDIETHTHISPPVSRAQERWPLLVYSHDRASYRVDNQPLLEELASWGFVVASVSHPYTSGGTVMEDGNLARFSPPELPQEPSVISLNASERNVENMWLLSMSVWVPDLLFVTRTLREMSGKTPCTWLTDKLDMDRVGFLGYGLGGTTAREACSRALQCDAIASLDGAFWHGTEVLMEHPVMYIKPYSEQGENPWSLTRATPEIATYTLRLEGTDHNSFSAFPSVLESFNLSNPEGHNTTTQNDQLIRKAVREFFLHTLKKMAPPSPPDNPRAHFESNQDPPSPTVMGRVFYHDDERNADLPCSYAWVEGEFGEMEASEKGHWNAEMPSDLDMLSISMSCPGMFPIVKTVRTRAQSLHIDEVLLSSSRVEEIATETGRVLDPDQGHILVKFRSVRRGHPAGPMEGGRAHLETGDRAFYPHDAQEFAQSTGSSGEAWFFNLPESDELYTVTLEHADHVCSSSHEGSRTPRKAKVALKRGHLSVVDVDCVIPEP